MDAMAEIRQTFFEECAEQLAELEAGLLAIENGEADSDTVNAVFRAVHSIKGGAGAFSLDDLVRFSHIFETTLDELRSDRLEASDVVIKVMLRAADALADLVTVARDGGTADASRNEGLAAELKELVAAAKGESPADVAAEAPEPEDSADSADDDFGFVPVAVDLDELIGGGGGGDQAYRIIFRPHAALYAKANDSVRVLRDLMELGEGNVQCDTSEIPLLSDLDPEGAYFTFTVDLTTAEGEEKIREVFEFVEDDCDLSIELILDADTGSADGAVDVDSDLADLLASLRGEAASEAATDAAPAAKAPKADKPKASKPGKSVV